MSEVLILVGGILTLILSLFHMRFYKIFHWKSEFGKLHQIQAKILYTIHFALALIFFGMGILILIYRCDLAKAKDLSLGILVFLSLFWFWRLMWQLIYFKSKSRLHIILCVWFFILLCTMMIPIMINR